MPRSYTQPSIALLSLAFLCWATPCQAVPVGSLVATMAADGGSIEVRRSQEQAPIVTHVAKADMRPYLHPIQAPDSNGMLTEFSPDHHPHQTGWYWGFTRVNERDYFHHFDGTYWKRVLVSILKATATDQSDYVQWQVVYDLLDDKGQGVLRESQIWTLRDDGDRYTFDLQWTGEGLVDATIGKYDYGGLFLRMPWKPGVTAEVVNNIRQRDQRAEGQRAVWLDVGVQVEGRADLAHVAIFDHPKNEGFPQSWRVDKQFGIGPVRARHGDWKIVRGEKTTIQHRLVAYTGQLDDVALTEAWSEYTGLNKDSIQWQLAQEEGRKAEFLTPQKAVASMTLQPGFEANVFASEPMIGQPMAFCWDAKGRLWIAENFDYETRQTGFSNDGTSRIVILEDTDRDGVADRRQVFLEGIPFPSAIAVGMGGLWLGAPPNLLFVPDRDANDQADVDAIEVRLTGWGIRDRHETLNSFHWGPDGWLYGLQGFATPSEVGKPKGKGRIYQAREAFPKETEWDGKPVEINGGVWRYHPTKDRFEVLAHGFSNPWGIDYDAHGQLFITACVIPHLWHVIPGGIYHRQGGSHFNPYVYSDITTIADHRHQSAHGGARIYQSDAFPEQYRGRIFMANIHEHALLTDILKPQGSGFIGHHGDDFMLANNAQWIGFSVEVGPDGAVYVLDWHDADICGKEVLNKETGRVFRIVARPSQATDFENRQADLNKLDDLSLAKLQSSSSAWHANQARTVLQYRAMSRGIQAEAIKHLETLIRQQSATSIRLRGLWALHVINALTNAQLVALLDSSDAYLRAWSIQLLCEDHQPSQETIGKFLVMAQTDTSPVVRLYLAAACQRLSDEARWSLLERLALRGDDNHDHNIPKMLWFALEPLVLKDPSRALGLAESSQISHLARCVARRLGDAERFDTVLQKIESVSSSAQLLWLLGLRDASEGRYDMKPPLGWATQYAHLIAKGGEIAKVTLQLSQQFGDAVAAEEMLETLRNRSASIEDRKQAIVHLAGRKRVELKPEIIKLLDEEGLRREAIRAVGAFDDTSLSKALLQRYSQWNSDEKMEVVYALATRTNHGNQLTTAIKNGLVPKSDIPAHVARLLRRVVGNTFVDVWGPIDELGADKEGLFAKYQSLLREAALKNADLIQGRAIFVKSCSACHKLHGEGGNVGPDITGANRSNLEYLLSNILTPSAIIQDAYRMHLILTEDGRVYSGIPSEENDRQLKLRVADREEPVLIAKSEIASRELSPISMMPDGILANLKDDDVISLFAYLQSFQPAPHSHHEGLK